MAPGAGGVGLAVWFRGAGGAGGAAGVWARTGRTSRVIPAAKNVGRKYERIELLRNKKE